MALDKDTLQEIKAYMDERNATLLAHQERDKLKSFSELEEKRDNRIKGWLKTISVVSGVSIAGLITALYFVVSSQAKTAASTTAGEVAQKYINDVTSIGGALENIKELQSDSLTALIGATDFAGQTKATLDRLRDLENSAATLLADNSATFATLKDVAANVENFATAAAGNTDLTTAILEKAVFPKGLVVASTVSCGSLLPSNAWSDFKPAIGRTIIGVGNVSDSPYRDGLENNREPWSDGYRVSGEATIGGAEIVTLARSNLPPHEHNVAEYAGGSANQGIGGGPNTYVFPHGSLGTAKQGNVPSAGTKNLLATPINNMPPYIALYFCKKD